MGRLPREAAHSPFHVRSSDADRAGHPGVRPEGRVLQRAHDRIRIERQGDQHLGRRRPLRGDENLVPRGAPRGQRDRHFATRDDLLYAIAVDTRERIAAIMDRYCAEVTPDPETWWTSFVREVAATFA